MLEFLKKVPIDMGVWSAPIIFYGACLLVVIFLAIIIASISINSKIKKNRKVIASLEQKIDDLTTQNANISQILSSTIENTMHTEIDRFSDVANIISKSNSSVQNSISKAVSSYQQSLEDLLFQNLPSDSSSKDDFVNGIKGLFQDKDQPPTVEKVEETPTVTEKTSPWKKKKKEK